MTYFPTPYRGSIIGVRGLDFRVRNGNGYVTSTIITRQLLTNSSHIEPTVRNTKYYKQ